MKDRESFALYFTGEKISLSAALERTAAATRELSAQRCARFFSSSAQNFATQSSCVRNFKRSKESLLPLSLFGFKTREGILWFSVICKRYWEGEKLFVVFLEALSSCLYLGDLWLVYRIHTILFIECSPAQIMMSFWLRPFSYLQFFIAPIKTVTPK